MINNVEGCKGFSEQKIKFLWLTEVTLEALWFATVLLEPVCPTRCQEKDLRILFR